MIGYEITMEEEHKYCGNCKNQPSPLQTCDWMKEQLIVYVECPMWEKKGSVKNVENARRL